MYLDFALQIYVYHISSKVTFLSTEKYVRRIVFQWWTMENFTLFNEKLYSLVGS